jgi:hypothetical protein
MSSRAHKISRARTSQAAMERRFSHVHESALYKHHSKEELYILCRDAGLPTKGDKRTLAKRLHEYILASEEVEFDRAMEEGEKALREAYGPPTQQ